MTMTKIDHATGEILPVPESAGTLARNTLMPQSYGELFQLSQAMFKAQMFGVKSPEQAMVVLMTGMELGFGPAQSMRAIHVINGKPVLSADLMVAVCKSRPHVCRYFMLVESTHEAATYRTQRVGEPEPVTISFTAAQAKAAGLSGKDTWQKHPDAMLRARASSSLARAVYPDLILGIYTEDEAEDIPFEPVDVTPPREQMTTAPYRSDRTTALPSAEADNRDMARQHMSLGATVSDEIAEARASFDAMAARLESPITSGRMRGELANRVLGRPVDSTRSLSASDWHKAAADMPALLTRERAYLSRGDVTEAQIARAAVAPAGETVEEDTSEPVADSRSERHADVPAAISTPEESDPFADSRSERHAAETPDAKPSYAQRELAATGRKGGK